MCATNEIINSKLSLLHANIRSLHQFNVVALTETWLNESNADVYGL